jgi:hypothetical protein
VVKKMPKCGPEQRHVLPEKLYLTSQIQPKAFFMMNNDKQQKQQQREHLNGMEVQDAPITLLGVNGEEQGVQFFPSLEAFFSSPRMAEMIRNSGDHPERVLAEFKEKIQEAITDGYDDELIEEESVSDPEDATGLGKH